MIQDDERTHNLEFDMCQAHWLVDKVRNNSDYAQNLYAALCNNEFYEQDVFEALKGRTWSCTWRYAGGLIADMRGEGEYLDWYCSGIGPRGNAVPEGTVTEEIRQDLAGLGWYVIEDPDPGVECEDDSA